VQIFSFRKQHPCSFVFASPSDLLHWFLSPYRHTVALILIISIIFVHQVCFTPPSHTPHSSAYGAVGSQLPGIIACDRGRDTWRPLPPFVVRKISPANIRSKPINIFYFIPLSLPFSPIPCLYSSVFWRSEFPLHSLWLTMPPPLDTLDDVGATCVPFLPPYAFRPPLLKRNHSSPCSGSQPAASGCEYEHQTRVTVVH